MVSIKVSSELIPFEIFIIVTGASSFLLGSIPFGYIITRVYKNIDIRNFGSKNIGATNVGRVIGWKYGFIVLFLDTLKGAIPVIFSKYFFTNSPTNNLHISLVIGGLAILGHVYTPFMRFRGGKGVATALGVCLSIIPLTTMLAVITFLMIYKLTGYISIGSILSSILMPIFYWLLYLFEINTHFSISILYMLIGLAIVILFLHRDNLLRVYQGAELKATNYQELNSTNETR